MMLPLVEGQSKSNCFNIILYLSLTINVILIVLVGFEQSNYFEGYETSYTEIILLEEAILNLENNTRFLNIYFQEIRNELAVANKTVQTLHGIFTNKDSGISYLTPYIDVGNNVMKLKVVFDGLNEELAQFNKIVDEININVIHVQEYSYFLPLLASKQVETKVAKEEIKNTLEDSSSMSNVPNEPMGEHGTQNDDVRLNRLIRETLTVEEPRMFNDLEYEDYEDDDSNELMSQLTSFKLSDLQVNWTDAMMSCYADGMQLASITSSAEQTKVVDLIRKADLGHVDFWLAGNDQKFSKRFVWATSRQPVTYTNWNFGEPNNAWSIGHGEQEHCISLVYNFNYRWNDSLCSKKKYFVCEERKKPASMTI